MAGPSLRHPRGTRACCTASTPPPSVSGVVYSADGPLVTLYTKADCSLCDVAKAVLAKARSLQPHTLEAVDITDAENAHLFAKYRYDIPVLSINGMFWSKHRITLEGTLEALGAAADGRFVAARGEPDAAKYERK